MKWIEILEREEVWVYMLQPRLLICAHVYIGNSGHGKQKKNGLIEAKYYGLELRHLEFMIVRSDSCDVGPGGASVDPNTQQHSQHSAREQYRTNEISNTFLFVIFVSVLFLRSCFKHIWMRPSPFIRNKLRHRHTSYTAASSFFILTRVSNARGRRERKINIDQ